MNFDYFKELDTAVTVCDKNAIIIYMNNKSQTTFPNTKLGDHLFPCHSGKSTEKIAELLANNLTNTYSIEKSGIKKIIHHTPWYHNGAVAGLIEFSIPVPIDMPHFKRD